MSGWFFRAAESNIVKDKIPAWIQGKFEKNNVPRIAKLQVAMLIINRTRFDLRRHSADIENGKWNTSNPWILTAPEIIKSMEDRWIVAENDSTFGTVAGKIGYITQGLSGQQGFMVRFKNATVGENEYEFTKSIGEFTKITRYGGHGNRAMVAFHIEP